MIPGTKVSLRTNIELLTLRLVNTFPIEQDRKQTLEILRTVTQRAKALQQEALKHTDELKTDVFGNIATKVGAGFQHLEMQIEFCPKPEGYAKEMQDLIDQRKKQIRGITGTIPRNQLEQATNDITVAEQELTKYKRRHQLT